MSWTFDDDLEDAYERGRESMEAVYHRLMGDYIEARTQKKNLEDMFMNVCRKAYMVKAGMITFDQLFATINGCLDVKVIDRLTWDYLLDSKTKDAEIKLQTKDILDKYLEEYGNDDVEEDTDALELIEDKKSKPRKKRQTKTEITKESKEQLYKELEEDKKWSQYASDPRNK